MTRWEYRQLDLETDPHGPVAGFDELDACGLQGWEVYAVTTQTRSFGHREPDRTYLVHHMKRAVLSNTNPTDGSNA